ncbi:MAG: hypothetical protein F6K36_29235 [Symploca sp. SIO3C6]|nr:hypothetical protein [Symploca sp. SIO3C6]
MDTKVATDRLRLTITLSDLAARKLTLWAKAHDKGRTTWARQIIESSIERNLELINKLVEECAEAKGMTVKELIQTWEEEDE